MSPASRRIAWATRIKMMMRHTWLIAAAAIMLCVGIGAIGYHLATQPTPLTIAVGPRDSDDARVVQALVPQFTRDRSSVLLRALIVDGGTRGAAAALDEGRADLAVVRHDTGIPKDGQAVAILRKNVAVFIVPSVPETETPATAAKPRRGKAPPKPAKAKPIEKIEELVGKRLGVVGRSPTNIDLLKAVLAQYNIPADKLEILATDEEKARPNAPGKISIVQFTPRNAGPEIRDSNVDAILSVGPVGSPVTASAIIAATRGKEPPTFLAIGAAEAIAERNPIYESAEIKAGAFGGSPPRPEEDTATIGVNHYIVARKSLSEALIADFTKNLFAARQAAAVEHPQAAKIETPSTDKDAAVPVHPGAAAYVDGELKNFFDRYSDAMFWGLMLLSFFGSALASIASYSKSDDRIRRVHSLERLLEITKAARAAGSLQAIDELQAETDTIQGDMIREVETGDLDQTAMMAFSVSFEQAQFALADRRAALQGQPRPPLSAVASR